MGNNNIHDCGYKNFFQNPVVVKQLPSVFPLLLYNGDRKWTAPVELSTLIADDIPGKYIPSFSYYKIAENEFSKETLLQIQNVVSALFYVENSVPEELAKEIDNLYDMVKNEKPDEIAVLTNWLRVIFRDDTRGIYQEVKQAEEIRTMFATKLEKYGEKLKKEALHEGIKKGKQEGKQEGKEEGEDKEGGGEEGVEEGDSQKLLCDACGKRIHVFFSRLEYVYCSTDCVQTHKRTLMAEAALKRFAAQA